MNATGLERYLGVVIVFAFAISQIGLEFKKTFIAQKGAHPVMYVPINYPIIEIGDSNIRENITVSPQRTK